MQFVLRSDPAAVASQLLRIRCPGCRDRVTLDLLGQDLRAATDVGTANLGQRKCPSCNTHVFVAYGDTGVMVSYPGETIDFDATDVPEPVREAFEEAIKCHANQCFVASAMMVRKSLEELCRDRGADGGNLKARVAALRGKVVLPEPMFAALDNLRLLGNDAAHVESREYTDVGQEELEVAIEVTKEILKATYQYDSLMGRLDALKRGAPDA